MLLSNPLIVIKGAGDLATGVAYRLYKSGFKVIMTEIAQPLVVRRTVSFAEAVYSRAATVEGVKAALAASDRQALSLLEDRVIPVMVDPEAGVVARLHPAVVIDAIMAKKNLHTTINDAPFVIALGPGFTAGIDVHAIIETKRGHNLGRVIYEGAAAPNTGIPGEVGGHTAERLLRSPVDGVVQACSSIGDQVVKGQIVALVGSSPVEAGISGLIRGLLHDGVRVSAQTKIGDIDPRPHEVNCYTISDKALAIGGGALEATLNFLFHQNLIHY